MGEGRWEVDTLRIFDDLIDGETVFFDIGAWIGPTTLYAAPVARQVICFEPDPIAFAELTRNLELNEDADWANRIEAHNRAVGPVAGTMKLGSQEGLGQSVSSALYHDEADTIDVEVIPFDSLADDERLNGARVFVKIDIEGGEYELLAQPSKLLQRPRTALCLSLHPRILRRRNRADSSGTPWAMVARRIQFVRAHQKLFANLPFRYFYKSGGEPLDLKAQMLRALFLGKFEREIVATNEPWNRSENAVAPSALASGIQEN